MAQDPEKVRIGLQVEAEVKERWEDFVEETHGEPKNLSSLIRIAVNEHVERHGGDGDGPLSPSSGGDSGGLTAEDRRKIERASEAATSVEETVDGLVNRVLSIEETVEEQSSRQEVVNHAAKILPTIRPTSERWTDTDVWAPPKDIWSPKPPTSSEKAQEASLRGETVRESTNGTPEQVGDYFGVDEIVARAALEQLREEHGFIERKTFDGDVYYWRNEPW